MNLKEELSKGQNAVILLRIILGGIFIVASYGKILDPVAFAGSIANYKILPSAPALVIATFLPWIEFLCGLSLIVGVLVRGSSLLISAMLVLFTAGVASAMARGLDISCGCFTQDPTAERIGWMKLGENCVLIATSILAFRQPMGRFSLVRFIQTRILHDRDKLT